jgi:DNA-directed RNA polymerase specialized sigma subunit
MSREEVAAELGLSALTIQRIEIAALRKLAAIPEMRGYL